MRERVGAFAAAGTAVGLLFASNHYDVWPMGDQAPWSVERPYIDIEARQPLPANVEKVVDASVEITSFSNRTAYRSEQGKSLGTMDTIWQGSGVLVNNGDQKVVVTAAHVLGNAIKECAHDEIAYSQKGPGVLIGRVEAQSVVAPSHTFEEEGYDYNGGADLAAAMPTSQDKLLNKASLDVQENVSVNVGDPIFVAGFGPRTAFEADPDPNGEAAAYRRPQIIGGYTILSQNHMLKFITDVASYGPTPDDRVRRGDSGGAVLSAEGEYLGEVTNAEDDKEVDTGREIEDRYKVDLPAAAEGKKFQVAVARLVDTKSLEQITTDTQPCTPTERQVVTVPEGTDIREHFEEHIQK